MHVTGKLALAVVVTLCLPLLGQARENPMRPPRLSTPRADVEVEKAPPRETWRLQSTLVAPGRRSAVINDRVVVPGERILGARVVRIERDRVTLKRRDRVFHIRLATYLNKNQRERNDD